MPYRRRKKTTRRKPRYLATRPRMMTRNTALKRMNQVSTDLKYFKTNGVLQSDLQGKVKFTWRTQDLVDNPPNGFVYMKELFDQYKCLAIQMKIFPANVGIEPDSAIFTDSAFYRGNTVIWSDQREEPNVQSPDNISDIISDASARIINSRRPYRRALYRPKGEPRWGSTQDQQTEPDTWDGAIQQLTTEAIPYIPVTPVTPAPTLWFWTLSYKVLFRGRRTPP